MNVLQINNTDFEGTIYNGHDLQISLNEAGINASELVLYKRTECDTTNSYVSDKELTWQHQYNEFEKNTGLFNFFEPFGGKIKYSEQFAKADIVHLQLLHNHVITLSELENICRLKPCVWTIHDLWAVTGHCIHPRDCDGWKNQCMDCLWLEDPFFELKYPKAHELWKAKEKIYKKINPDIIVASDFTKKFVEQSPLMAHFTNIHKIPFGIDLKTINFEDSRKIRKEWNIPLENVVISFRLNKSKLKGVKYLVKALEGMHAKNVTVLAVDKGDSSMLDTLRSKYQVIELGAQDWQGMQKFYQVSDVFVMPSLAETFGLMAVEAMACKCTVVVFEGTVLPEITFAPDCGVSVPYKDDRALGEVLDHLAASPAERAARGELGYKLVHENYKYSDYVKRHIEVYNQINNRLTDEKRRWYQLNYEKALGENEKMQKSIIVEEKKKHTMFEKLRDLSGGNVQKICIFCAGAFAEKAYEILTRNGIMVDVISDNNPEKWGYWNYGLSCISREQLLKEKEVLFIVVANKHPEAIQEDLKQQGCKHVINYYDLEKIDRELMELYGQNRYAKIAELDYSDTKTMELIEFMNRKINGMSQYYENQIEELKKKTCEAKPVKAIAMYLPQFHETKENNEWWGEGFTEWRAVKKAKPLYEGHYQPHVPLNDNYYNLLEKQTMEWQAELAKKANVYGFCFYHYWFKDGRRILEKPAENLLQWSDIDIHFCFSWANESWVRTWSNVKGGNAWVDDENNSSKEYADEKGVLLDQQYGSEKDWKEHFDYLLPFFKDERYIKIDGKPVFMIYRPELVDCMDDMLGYWKKLAKMNGLPGIYIMCANCENNIWAEVDARYIQEFNYSYSIDTTPTAQAVNWKNGVLTYDYDVLWKNIINRKYNLDEKVYLGACVNFDCTPRHGKKGNLTVGGTPEKFAGYFEELCKKSIRRNNEYVFINAWNEWGEGMHLEPDSKDGNAYLEAVKTGLSNANGEYKKLALENDLAKDEIPETGVSLEQYNHMCKRYEKFAAYFNLFDSWFTLKEENSNIEEMLLKRGFKTIAVYGIGKVGKHFVLELQNSKINIAYMIDRKINGDTKYGIPVYAVHKDMLEVDAIIVTAVFDFENIKLELERFSSCPIISLDEIFQWK